MRNPAESDMRETLTLSNLINSNLQGGDDPGGRTSCTSAESRRRGTEGERELVDNAVETPISLASSSASKADDATRWMVKRDIGQAGHQQGYKYYVYTVLISVFKLTLRMQTWAQILITACILSMVSSVPTLFFNTFIFLKNLYTLEIHPYKHRGVKDHILWCLKQI